MLVLVFRAKSAQGGAQTLEFRLQVGEVFFSVLQISTSSPAFELFSGAQRCAFRREVTYHASNRMCGAFHFRELAGGQSSMERGQEPRQLVKEEPDHFVSTEAICNELVHLINQPRNAWTFTVDLRSYWQWRPRVAARRQG